MNRDILAGVALLAVALVVAGAVLLSESYLKSSPADSTGPETQTEVSPSKIPTTTVATAPPTSGSSTSYGGVAPTSVSPSVTPTTRPASGSSGDSSPGPESPTGVPATAVAATRTVSGPPSFTLIVTPVEARARPGDTIRYTMSIEPKGGFDQPVSLRLDVSALFLYHNSFDLGTVSPPYPTILEYSFVVPGEVPGGITVKGVLSAEGGGYKDEQDLVLIVGN